MASKKIKDLSVLDWDDTALIKAYNKGMSLRVKDFEEESAKDVTFSSKKNELQWVAGDYCRAVYPSDNLVYEAKVVAVSGDTCTVEFLGYDEEVEVNIDTLSKSRGKIARKKQIKRAKEYFSAASADESAASGDDSRNEYSDMQSPHHQKRESVHMNHIKQMDHFRDHTAAESTFQHSVYPTPGPCNGMQPTTQTMMPPPPPMLHGADVAQNPSLCAMLSSWYMAGYYTGLHQAQKGQCHQQRCCCRPSQNFCHH